MSIRNTHESAAEFTARMRGQQIVVREAMRVRRMVTFGKYADVHLAAGERVTVESMINAGFRGMEVGIRTAEGHYISGISETAFVR